MKINSEGQRSRSNFTEI